jgi:hypothetical protein
MLERRKKELEDLLSTEPTPVEAAAPPAPDPQEARDLELIRNFEENARKWPRAIRFLYQLVVVFLFTLFPHWAPAQEMLA